jgi:hypothetical protein
MKFQSPANNVIVQIKQKYNRAVGKIAKLAAIQQHSSVDPANFVNIYGTVVSVPRETGRDMTYKDFSKHDIRVGDIAIFSYSVVYEFMQTDPEAEPIYKNSFWWDGQEYWAVDITKLYAVVRAGEIRMQNGYVMVEGMEQEAKIYLPQNIRKSVKTTTATLTQICNPVKGGKNIDCKPGDTVVFNPNILTTYRIDSNDGSELKEFGILQQRHILGKILS